MTVKNKTGTGTSGPAGGPDEVADRGGGMYLGSKSDPQPYPPRQGKRCYESSRIVGKCRFLATCPTYNDRLVPRTSKGRTGCGCTEQSDEHRKHHCQAFAYKLLAGMLSKTLSRHRRK